MAEGIRKGREYRLDQKEWFYFNWSLDVPLEFQQPFQPTHEAMAALDLHHRRKPHALAADLRRAFSGIVAGHVKQDLMLRLEEFGPFQTPGGPDITQTTDALTSAFVDPPVVQPSGDYHNRHKVFATPNRHAPHKLPHMPSPLPT